MELLIKGNPNYTASIVSIKNIIDLEDCDNIKGTTIFGNHVIISKDVKAGDMGIYFPVETKISDEFLSHNNLFDKPELNRDKTKKGFFSSKGRVRCVKLRGFKSDGFWIPIESLVGLVDRSEVFKLKEGDSFDHINGNKVCEKYVVIMKELNSNVSKNNKKSKIKLSRIISNQFRFHIDTEQLGRNVHKINLEDVCSISQKLHGTSGISSLILCKRKLNLAEKFLKKIGIKIIDTEYDNIFSSRKVIKNDDLLKNHNHYYSVDIWSIANEELKLFLTSGMTLYYEIVGYLPDGKPIQGKYDYGCKTNEHKIFIYRITSTSTDGKVFEWSMLQIQQWCKLNGLNCVPILYYGTVYNLYYELYFKNVCYDSEKRLQKINFDSDLFLQFLTEKYLEKKCTKENFEVYCNNDVWDEGIVLRKECLDIEAYKYKSYNFKASETASLDKGETNIEDNQEEL